VAIVTLGCLDSHLNLLFQASSREIQGTVALALSSRSSSSRVQPAHSLVHVRTIHHYRLETMTGLVQESEAGWLGGWSYASTRARRLRGCQDRRICDDS
jgi:hypothetical protein